MKQQLPISMACPLQSHKSEQIGTTTGAIFKFNQISILAGFIQKNDKQKLRQ